jgi:hypothetical protein
VMATAAAPPVEMLSVANADVIIAVVVNVLSTVFIVILNKYLWVMNFKYMVRAHTNAAAGPAAALTPRAAVARCSCRAATSW